MFGTTRNYLNAEHALLRSVRTLNDNATNICQEFEGPYVQDGQSLSPFHEGAHPFFLY